MCVCVFACFSYSSVQIWATIGVFACSWPDGVENVLGLMEVSNFDWNLMLFACSLQTDDLVNWILYQSLPLFYAGIYLCRVPMRPDFKNGAFKWRLATLDILYLAVTGVLLKCKPWSNLALTGLLCYLCRVNATKLS